VSTEEEAEQVFLRVRMIQELVSLLARLFGRDKVCRFAEHGDALAQAMMAGLSGGEQRFRWAEKSTAQGERDGFHWLG
jgi:hypothetical protein